MVPGWLIPIKTWLFTIWSKGDRRFHRFQGVIAGLVLMGGLWVAMVLPMPNDTGILVVGAPSPVSIRAKRSASFTSDIRTEEERTKAENRIENLVYVTDFDLPSEQRTRLTELLTTITSVRNDPTLNAEQKREKLTNLPNSSVVFSSTIAATIADLDESSWDNVRRWSINTYNQAVSEHSYEITEETMTQLRERTLPYWTNQIPAEQQELVLFFTTAFLRINRTLDREATLQRKQEARDSVPPYKVSVQEGESIVRVGDTVTPEMIEKADKTGSLPRRQTWTSAGGTGMLSGLLALTFMLTLAFAQKTVPCSTRPARFMSSFFRSLPQHWQHGLPNRCGLTNPMPFHWQPPS